MNKVLIVTGFVITLLFPYRSNSQDFDTYSKHLFINGTDTLPYRMLLPEGYDESKSYPLVMFLHGAGERGKDNEKQLVHGGAMFLEPGNRTKFPAIVVFPQCKEDGFWVDISTRSKDSDELFSFDGVFREPIVEQVLLKGLLDKTLATLPVNEEQIYVMGLSMGAFGTLELLARWPVIFAGAVAICGGGNLEATSRYADKVPLWITHGADDTVVSVEYSRTLYQTLKGHGAKVRYTEFPDINHNAWDPTFAMDDLLPWLFEQKNPTR